MISEKMQKQILKLLAVPKGSPKKLSQRKIALFTGISRGSVTTIKKHGKVRKVPEPFVPDSVMVTRKPGYCDTCKAVVPMPCPVCEVRRLRKAGKLPPSIITGLVVSKRNRGLDLNAEDHKRHLEVIAVRAEQIKMRGIFDDDEQPDGGVARN